MKKDEKQDEGNDFMVVAHGKGGEVLEKSLPNHDLNTANNLCIIAGSEKCSVVVSGE